MKTYCFPALPRIKFRDICMHAHFIFDKSIIMILYKENILGETFLNYINFISFSVMRLTRPTLFSSMVVTCDSKDLPGSMFNNELKHDIASVTGSENLAIGQFLLLPQSFGLANLLIL